MEHLLVKSGDGEYPVHFVESVEKIIGYLEALKQPCFIVDRKVYTLYPGLGEYLSSKTYLLIDATEDEKTWDGVGRVIEWYQENRVSKANQVVAIGGGIIQDIVCFSASVFYRGIEWHLIPTTVLSMADSCIGAKCAVNFNNFKNQVGTFHSPRGVYICSEFAKTLELRDLRSGYGEILKLAITGGKESYCNLEVSVAKDGLSYDKLLDLVRTSLVVKKGVIEADEYELDYRRILNYGHTLGHALESVTDHFIPHGLAVAWGMDIINFLSWQRGLLSEEIFAGIHKFIKTNLPFSLNRKIEADVLLASAKRDKKASGSSVNLILLASAWELKISKTEFNEELIAQVKTYLESYNVYQ
jgi:3-dehydroquinate synthase